MCEAKDCSVAHRFGQEDNTRFRKEQIVKSTCCICSFLNLVLCCTRQVPDPETFDPRVHSAWKLEKLDIQLATPANYDSKVSAHREVLRRRLYKGLSKAARYALLCSLM